MLILDLIDKCPFAHPTIFMRTEILKKYNLNYNTEYEPAEDYKMWTILAKYGKLANIDEILLYYNPLFSWRMPKMEYNILFHC